MVVNQQTEQQHHEDARHANPCRQIIEEHRHQQQSPERHR